MLLRKKCFDLASRWLICAALVLSSIPSLAMGQQWSRESRGVLKKAEVVLDIGQPSIWSLAQAHYLLASMREGNRGLGVTSPSLNPNEVNGLRVDVLSQVFGADVEFNGVAGQQNKFAAQQFQADMARKQLARVRLDESSNERQSVYDHLSRIARNLAPLQISQAQLNAIPAAQRTADQNNQLADLNTQIDKLTAEQAQLTSQRQSLDADIDRLTKESTTSLTSATLSSVFGSSSSPGTTSSTGMPLTNNISGLIGKIAGGSASLAASTQLDNYIQMQYELISKQLTLLRDEVGPGKRLVFLELPTSIFTVPNKSEDYLVDIDWHVSKYFGPEPGLLSASSPQDQTEDQKNQSAPVTLELMRQVDSARQNVQDPLNKMLNEFEKKGLTSDRELRALLSTQEAIAKGDQVDGKAMAADQAAKELRKDDLKNLTEDEIKKALTLASDIPEQFRQNPSLLKMRWVQFDEITDQAKKEELKAQFRTLDVIPRQSALNINDANGKSTGLNLLGGFQWLTGLGAKVSYQRQREIYQQFVHQESFATGFGKGMEEFGWTFGPVPGTSRIAPGTRTTYAILVIPSKVLGLGLKVTAKTFKKKNSPDDKAIKLGEGEFEVLVPDKMTEGFWIDGITYNQVIQGQRLTVVLTGRYFSPQTGILVNGVPLSRAVSIGKNESLVTMLTAGAQGEYEYLSPNKIVLSFSMGADYTGTPIITLVTPEKTSAINFFDLDVNFGNAKHSLRDLSKTTPMFLHRLVLSDVQIERQADGARLARLIGDGFRPGGELSINGINILTPPGGQSPFKDTGRYEFNIDAATFARIAKAAGDPDLTRYDAGKWIIRYRQHTELGYGDAVYQLPRPLESQYDINSYTPNAITGEAAMDVTIRIVGNISKEQHNPDDMVVGSITRTSDGAHLIRLTLKKDKIEAPLFLIKDDGLVDELVIERPAAPSIDSVVNLQTGKPEGPAGTEQLIKIIGKHLKHVVQVQIDSTEAQILGAEPNVLLVRTAKMGEGVGHVFLKSRLTIGGKLITNVRDFSYPNKATYTFKKV